MKNFHDVQTGTRCLVAWLSIFGLISTSVPGYGLEPSGTAVRLPPVAPVPAPIKVLQSVSPFSIVGFIQKATLDNSADIFSGGTITVNGITVVVPRNTLFQLPAFALTWQELFKLAPSSSPPPGLPCATNGMPCSTGPYGLTTPNGPQTGLALSDSPAPASTYEVTIIGNRVVNGSTDQYIAGLMFMSQHSLNSGQGYINYIDYAKGELWISSTLGGQTGARVRMNTPIGRYGISQTPDQRFTADEENPTMRADTGYPMCIPRFDPLVATDSLCPQWNRPVDPVTKSYQTIFTMPPPPSVSPIPAPMGPMPPPDATQQAPFEINDYVTYAGTLVNDVNGTYISAHTIVASLGIFTAPGTMPAYVAIEEMLLGVGGPPNPLFPQEAVEKLLIEAVTTDSSQLVDFYAVDVDACGTQKHRFYGTADPFGPPVAGKKGRARLRTNIGNFLPATREMHALSRTLTLGAQADIVLPRARTYANGLVAGQYRAPNAEFIFPENLVAGSPEMPFALQEFPFLTSGSGPYSGAGTNAIATPYGALGPISPWPGLIAPSPTACGSAGAVLTAPRADAGVPQTVVANATVTLNGSASVDTNTPALPLSYVWVQSSGPNVILQEIGLAKPYFTAPQLPPGSAPAVLTFQLVVSNGFASSAIATTIVTVNGTPVPVVNAGPDQSVTGGTQVRLTGSAVDTNTGAGTLKYQWTQTAGTPVTLDIATSPTPSFKAPTLTSGQAPTTLTFRLTVTDALNLSGSATTNVGIKSLVDTVSITTATYRFSGSKLSVSARSSVTNGAPVLTLNVPGKPGVVMAFDPTSANYSVPQFIVNPMPGSISVTSSFGGSATAGVVLKP